MQRVQIFSRCMMMKKFALVAFAALLALTLASAASIELKMPEQGYVITPEQLAQDWSGLYMRFALNYSPDIVNKWDCNALMDSNQVIGPATNTAFSGNYDFEILIPRSMLQKGAHTWQIQCILQETTAQKSVLNSETRTFYVGNAPNVTLVSPESGILTKNTTHEFVFSYDRGDFGAETASCYLHIRGKDLGPLSLPSGETGTIEIDDMQKEVFEWYVVCDGIQSEKRLLLIEPEKYTQLNITYPNELEQTNDTSPKFEFLYQQGDGAPKEVSCNLVLNSKVSEYWANISDGESTFLQAQNLTVGNNYWFIECWDGNKSVLQTQERILQVVEGELDANETVNNQKEPAKNETTLTNNTAVQNETGTEPEQKSGNNDMATMITIVVLAAIAVLVLWQIMGSKKEAAAEKPKEEQAKSE